MEVKTGPTLVPSPANANEAPVEPLDTDAEVATLVANDDDHTTNNFEDPVGDSFDEDIGLVH
jgi:hypothetical protein